MFTGIVEELGRIDRLEALAGARVALEIAVSEAICEGMRIGDSVAIDGCCLTATAIRPGRIDFEAVPETLRLTSLGERKAGDRVNIERAMPAGGRLDGHIVQGHVDGTGILTEVRKSGDDVLLRFEAPVEVARYLVPKGSVTVDGVSLTVVEPDENGFSVALIPHTLAVTTLGERKVGQRVNLEADVLGKYVYRYLQQSGALADKPAGAKGFGAGRPGAGSGSKAG